MAPGHGRAYAILLAMPLFFVSNLVLGRAAVEAVAPWTLAFLRWFLASLILVPLAGAGLVAHRDALLREWPMLLLLGFLGMGICGGGVYMALKLTTATNATLIYTASPVVIVLLDALINRRKLPLSRALGVGAGFIGVAVIVLKGDLAALARLDLNVGDIGIVVAAIAWAFYSLLLKRRALQSFPTMPLFLAIAAAGTAVLVPFMLAEVALVGTFPSSLTAWASIVALAIFPSVLAFSAFQYGIKVLGPSLAGVFMYLLPPYGVALAVVFLGEAFRAYHAAGLALVFAGIVLATWAGRPAAR